MSIIVAFIFCNLFDTSDAKSCLTYSIEEKMYCKKGVGEIEDEKRYEGG